MSEKARERLDAIELLQDLGAGYQIALKDLEIRGAGNILGKEQSGAIMQVGLNLYCQMLDEARSEMEQYNH
jgi:transcription-repair coupling factor (superfamily II helicase)